MSGGYFNHTDYTVGEFADSLRKAIAKIRKKEEYYDFYSDDFLNEMITVYNMARELRLRLHRIDWVLSGDDGEDNYFKRLPKEMADIEFDNPVNDVKWLSDDDD